MRLTRRPQGRSPRLLAPTRWQIEVDHDGETRWYGGDGLSGLHRWLLDVSPNKTDPVRIWRNNDLIFNGSWDGLAGDGTLW